MARATGGNTITTSGIYTIHTFTGNGTFTPDSTLNKVDIFLMAGGGGGGYYAGGGGGGGGKVYQTDFSITPSTPISVTIGGGGAGRLQSQDKGRGLNGGDSIFSSLTAYGGGGGGGGDGGGGSDPSSGGCGGGAATFRNSNVGTGSQGSNGLTDGRGGGAGANPGGSSVLGYTTDISGSSVTYGAGGQTSGSTSGGNNTGDGGQGAYSGYNAGNGGSGVVIIRYITSLANGNFFQLF